jgi:hypothetical protein
MTPFEWTLSGHCADHTALYLHPTGSKASDSNDRLPFTIRADGRQCCPCCDPIVLAVAFGALYSARSLGAGFPSLSAPALAAHLRPAG